MWGNKEVEWVAKSSEGLSGGLLIMWKAGLFNVIFQFSGDGFIVICTNDGGSGRPVYFVNIYASCHMDRKRKMWDDFCMSKGGFEKGE